MSNYRHLYTYQGDVGCDSDALYFNFDIFGKISKHPELGSADAREVACHLRDGEFESSDSSPDIGDEIGCSVEQLKTDDDINPDD